MAGKDRNDKTRTAETQELRNRFARGLFPVLTLGSASGGKSPARVLGLVVARGYDAEEVFFAMLSRASSKGADTILGYREDIAFHPDGSRFYTCYGTAAICGQVSAARETAVAALS